MRIGELVLWVAQIKVACHVCWRILTLSEAGVVKEILELRPLFLHATLLVEFHLTCASTHAAEAVLLVQSSPLGIKHMSAR